MDAGWDTPGNAERYAVYTEKHPLYDRTSRALAADLGLVDGELVVDLACGTGATTRALLDACPGVRVIAIDAAITQLELAKRQLTDPHVTFFHAPAERAHEVIAERADAVICNAAVWQLKPPALHAVAELLRSGGRFAFNVPAQLAPDVMKELCDADPSATRFMRRQAETLERAMLEEARALGFRPAAPTPGAGRRGFVERRFLDALHAEGFRIERRVLQAEPITPAAAFDWYLIPVFRTNVLAGASLELGEEALRRAYEKWSPSAADTFAVWVRFLAIKT